MEVVCEEREEGLQKTGFLENDKDAMNEDEVKVNVVCGNLLKKKVEVTNQKYLTKKRILWVRGKEVCTKKKRAVTNITTTSCRRPGARP